MFETSNHNQTAKEQKDEQISRIIQLRSELNKKALTEAFLQRMNCADRALMLERLETEKLFVGDFNNDVIDIYYIS